MLVPRLTPVFVAVAVGVGFGLASASAEKGLAASAVAFIATAMSVELAISFAEGSAHHSPERFARLVRAHVRRSGINGIPVGGRGGVFSEPVIVTWHNFRKHEVYDQDGSLLASGRSGHGQSLEWSTPNGQPLLTVSPDHRGKSKLITLYTATSADGTESGSVITAGKEKGLITVAGETVGRLKRWPLLRSLLGWRRSFYVFDTNLVEVGRITHESRLAKWTVIEIDGQAARSLRKMLLAADAAVNYWERQSGGGG